MSSCEVWLCVCLHCLTKCSAKLDFQLRNRNLHRGKPATSHNECTAHALNCADAPDTCCNNKQQNNAKGPGCNPHGGNVPKTRRLGCGFRSIRMPTRVSEPPPPYPPGSAARERGCREEIIFSSIATPLFSEASSSSGGTVRSAVG
jgi:hypothetical protein